MGTAAVGEDETLGDLGRERDHPLAQRREDDWRQRTIFGVRLELLDKRADVAKRLARLGLEADINRRVGDADAKLKAPAGDLVQVGGVLRELVDRLGVDRRYGSGERNALGRQCEADALRHVAEGTRYRDPGKAAPINLARGIECGTPASRLGNQVEGRQRGGHRAALHSGRRGLITARYSS